MISPPPDTPRRPVPRWAADALEVAVVPAALALLSVLAAVPWLRAFDVHLAPLVLVLAAVAPFAISTAASRLAHLPAPAAYGAALLGLVVLALAALDPDPVRLVSSLVHTPDRLLTETLPLTGGRALLAVPVVVVWVAGTAAAELGERTRGGAALAVPTAAYVLAYGVSTGAPGSIPWSGGLLLAGLVVAALALRARQDARRAGTVTPLGPTGQGRRLLAGVLAGGVLAALAATQVSELPVASAHPTALRRHPATASGLVVDPVDVIGALRDDDPHAPPTDLAEVTTSVRSTGYAPVALLDDYDGDIWSFAQPFHPTGGRIPRPAPDSPGAEVVDGNQTVTQSWQLLARWPLPFIPALARPERVTGLPIDDDAVTGMITPAGALALPAAYAVISGVPRTTVTHLPAGSQIDTGTVPAADAVDLALPAGTTAATTSALQFAASLTGQRPAPTVAFVQAVVAGLARTDQRVDPALPVPTTDSTVSRGGTSLAEVINAVTVSHKATPEQFATFMAVVARGIGIPARIATGFLLPAASTTGTSVVTNRDAWTWDEIPVLGYGWVVVDPTPAATASAAAPPTPAAASSATTLPPRRANAVPDPGLGGHRALAPRSRVTLHHRTHQDPWPGRLLLALVVVLAALLIGPAIGGARRLVRRQLRRGPGAAGLAVGAWLELLDGLEVVGLRAPPGATGAEVVARVEARYGPEVAADVAAVAALAEAAVYRPAQPPGPAEADAAWRTQRALRATLRRSLDRTARWLALSRVGHQPRRSVGPPRPGPRSLRPNLGRIS